MKDIKIIQEKMDIIESLCIDDCINKSVVIRPLKQAIENLIARNKELESALNNSVSKDEIKAKIEELADNEHNRWANWQKYVHSKCIKNLDGSLTIPKELVEHWEYEINTKYKDLPENIKESDRKEVRQILKLLNKGE